MPTFVGVGAETLNNLTIPFPAGSTGDLLVMFWESDTATDVAAASGWTDAGHSTYGVPHAYGCLWKIASSASSGTQVFTGMGGAFFEGFIERWSGTHQTAPINVIAFDNNPAGPTATSITTTVNGCTEVGAVTNDAGYPSGQTLPTGFTIRLDGSSNNFYSASRNQTSAGATGTSTWGAGTAGVRGIIHLAIAPPPSALAALVRIAAALATFAGAGSRRLGLQAGTPPPIFNAWSRVNVSVAGPGPFPAGVLGLGLLPGLVETVPVPLVARAVSTSPAAGLGVAELGLLPNLVESVPLALIARAVAPPGTPPAGLFEPGLLPGLVESVPLAYELVGVARDLVPGPGGLIGPGIVIAAAPAAAVLGWPARGVALVAAAGAGAIELGLQPGTAPVSAVYVAPIAGAAILLGSGQGSLALGLNPSLALLVPPVPVLSGTAPQGPPPGGAIELGLLPGLVESVPLAYVARAAAGPGPLAAGAIELGLQPGTAPAAVPLALIARSSSRPGFASAGYRLVGFVVAGVVVLAIPPMTVTWWSKGTATAVAAGTVSWMDDGTLVVVDLGTARWTSKGTL